nr:transforming growth factor beta-1 proprotein-like protein [Wadden Sea poxvirus]WGO62764.1 transforming growth factor beta-1 proprotein-like protein [Wadden Sea poxvirus]
MLLPNIIILLYIFESYLFISTSTSTSSYGLDNYDYKKIKDKLIDDIRTTFLQKLRINNPPVNIDVYDTISPDEDTMNLYNMTKNGIFDDNDNDYVSKEYTRLSVSFTDHNKNIVCVLYNTSNFDNDKDLVTNVKLYVKTLKSEHRTILTLNRFNKNRQRFIDSVTILPNTDNWIYFDFTSIFLKLYNKDKHNVKLCLQSYEDEDEDEDEDSTNSVDIKDVILIDYNDVTDKPFVLVTNTHKQLSNKRKIRSLDQANKECDVSEECCLKKLYIDFRKDLGWKWINEPKGYHSNYCIGNCFTNNTSSHHPYNVLTSMLKVDNSNNNKLCCRPKKTSHLSVTYYIGRKPKVDTMNDMIVDSCGCY